MNLSYFISVVQQAGPRSLVHQLLNGYGALREGELPGPWLVAAGAELGHRAPAVRQMLRRMLATRELDVRRDGRANQYRLAELSRTGSETGRRKLFGQLGRPLDARAVPVPRGRARDARTRSRDPFAGGLRGPGPRRAPAPP